MTPALAGLAAWCAGLGTAEVLPLGAGAGALAALAAGLALVLALVVRPVALPLAVAAALLGAARAELPAGDPNAAARAPALAGRLTAIEGTVADDARQLPDGFEVLVAPDSIVSERGRERLAGNILVRAHGELAPDLGDRVAVSGKLALPADRPGFDRHAYLAQRGAFLELHGARITIVHRTGGPRVFPGWLRNRYREAVTTLLPRPHAALLIGVVLGVRAGIPKDLQRDLIATGLVHLLVLSGLKVAVFARLVAGLISPLLGRAAIFPVLALIVLYALAGGATPAAVRAAVMGGVTLLAGHLGRPAHVWTSLAATAAVMLGWRPELAWDVGFQLSFVGTAAIILLTPGIARRLDRLPHALREPFAVTCSAQVGTVPLMATDFHVLSPVAPFANAAVLPLLPAMVLGGLLLAPLAGLPEIGRLAMLPLDGLLAYLEQVARLLARVPAAAISVPTFPPWTGAAYYAGLVAAVASSRLRGNGRHAALVTAVAAPLLIGLGATLAWARPVAQASVLAVGEGQAVLLSGPNGYVLVDGGSNPARLADELGGRLPPWRRKLEALVITGGGLGHAGGLPGLAFPAGAVLLPAGPTPGAVARAVALDQAARGATLHQAHAGESLSLAGLRIEVLAPEPRPPDASQLALRIVGPSGRSFCDFADLDREAQVQAAARLSAGCDYLLLPAGGRAAPAPELLVASRPRRLIVSSGDRRLARELPPQLVTMTSEEGSISVPL